MRTPLPALLVIGLGGACFVDPGPAGLSEGESDGSGTASATTTTTTTSGASTATTTMGGSATTTTTTTSGGESSGEVSSGSTSGGAPTTCWERAIDDWDEVVQVADAELGSDPRNPVLSPDGLTLTYVAFVAANTPPHRPYQASRGGLGEPFVSGELLATWPDLPKIAGHPKIVGDEMVLMLPGFASYDLARSLRVDGVWLEPEVMPGFDEAADEYYPSLTADGARLVFVRADGEAVPGVDALSPWALYEASRQADAPSGTAWGAINPSQLAFPENPDYPHWRSCPVFSPDGLHLLLATSYPKVVDAGDPSAAVEIAELRRLDRDAPWSAPALAPSLHQPGRLGCPGGITEDGCQMIYAELILGGMGDDPYTIWIARRSPTP